MRRSSARTTAGPITVACLLLASCLSACTNLPQSAPPEFIQENQNSPWPGQDADQVRPGESIRFQQINTAEGLSESVVTAILQDRVGFLWVGTEDGLNRYDGYQFTIYKPDPDDPYAISDRWVNALHEDSRGDLWVGTMTSLERFDPHSGHFFRMEDPYLEGPITAISETGDGLLWVATQQGLVRLEPSSGSTRLYRHSDRQGNSLSSGDIKSIFVDSQNRLWVGTSNGLSRFAPESDSFVHYVFGELCNCSQVMINTIDEDDTGRIWLGTAHGLIVLNPGTGGTLIFRHDPNYDNSLGSDSVQVIRFDRFGNLWIGLDNGLDYLDLRSRRFYHYHHRPYLQDSLSADTIMSLYEDRGGVIWIGTYGGGLNTYYWGQHQFSTYRQDPLDPNSLNSELVFPIEIDSTGVVWIGTFGGGLNRYDPSTGRFTHFLHDPDDPRSLLANFIMSIYAEPDGDALWIGSTAGMDRFDPRTQECTHFVYLPGSSASIGPGTVMALFMDREGLLWVGQENGVSRYDPEKDRFTRFTRLNQDPESPFIGAVVAIAQDNAGGLWFGTMGNGLLRFDTATQTFIQYQHDEEDPGSLSNNIVLSIFPDRMNRLWIGTGGGGINLYLPFTDSFTAFTEKEGLINNVVYGLLEDRRGDIWMSTNSGLTRMDADTLAFENYPIKDSMGIAEFSQFAFAAGRDGSLYFGGVGGFIRFKPDQLQRDPYQPNLVLTSISMQGRAVVPSALAWDVPSVTLRWPETTLEFEFAALSYANPQDNQYAYMLEGFDTGWNMIGSQRNGRYTNLPGGDYTLRIVGSNHNGTWNSTGINIAVHVIPPIWKRLWFQALIAAMLGGAVWAGIRLRTMDMRKRNEELSRTIEERTHEIEKLFTQTQELAIMEERNRLARDLHDSAKQKAFAGLAQLGAAKQMFNQDKKRARHHLEEGEDLVSEVIQELTILIQELYPAAIKEKGLPAALREYVFDWKESTGIDLALAITGERPLGLKIEQAIYRIVQEALSNIARHSACRRAELSLTYGPQEAVLEIQDDGCGFLPEASKVGMGLRGMHERAASIQATLHVDSEPGRGTRISMRVPLPA